MVSILFDFNWPLNRPEIMHTFMCTHSYATTDYCPTIRTHPGIHIKIPNTQLRQLRMNLGFCNENMSTKAPHIKYIQFSLVTSRVSHFHIQDQVFSCFDFITKLQWLPSWVLNVGLALFECEYGNGENVG